MGTRRRRLGSRKNNGHAIIELSTDAFECEMAGYRAASDVIEEKNTTRRIAGLRK